MWNGPMAQNLPFDGCFAIEFFQLVHTGFTAEDWPGFKNCIAFDITPRALLNMAGDFDELC